MRKMQRGDLLSKVIASALSIVMVWSFFPTSALAEIVVEEQPPAASSGGSDSNGQLPEEAQSVETSLEDNSEESIEVINAATQDDSEDDKGTGSETIVANDANGVVVEEGDDEGGQGVTRSRASYTLQDKVDLSLNTSLPKGSTLTASFNVTKNCFAYVRVVVSGRAGAAHVVLSKGGTTNYEWDVHVNSGLGARSYVSPLSLPAGSYQLTIKSTDASTVVTTVGYGSLSRSYGMDVIESEPNSTTPNKITTDDIVCGGVNSLSMLDFNFADTDTFEFTLANPSDVSLVFTSDIPTALADGDMLWLKLTDASGVTLKREDGTTISWGGTEDSRGSVRTTFSKGVYECGKLEPGTYRAVVNPTIFKFYPSDSTIASLENKLTYALSVVAVPEAEKVDIADATIAPIPAQLRTGSAVTPKPTVTHAGETLTLGTDYTLSYRNNTNAGTATVIVTGKGNYTGEKSATFRIGSKSISNCNVSLRRTVFLEREIPAEPYVSVEDKDEPGPPLEYGTDYTVTYLNNDKLGKASAVVTGMGDYVGTKTLTFDIVDTIDLDEAGTYWGSTISLACSPDSFFYEGEPIEPEVRLCNLYEGITWEKGVDYDVTYYSNNKVGKATAVVTGKGCFTGTATVNFLILNRSDIRLDSDDIIATFDDYLFWFYTYGDDGELLDGPVYLWRDGEPMPKPKLSLVYDDFNIGMLGLSYELTEGYEYSVVYRKVSYSDPVTGVMTIATGISPIGGVRYDSYYLMTECNVSMMNLDEYWLEQREYLYEGSPVKPKLRQRSDFIEGVDYKLSYRKNNAVGTCEVTVIGIGQFTGSATIEVPIVDKYSGPDLGDCIVELEQGQDLSYTGKPVTPKVRVTDPMTGEVLDPEYDYDVVYDNNVKAGTATARVIPHGGYSSSNYQGHNSVNFVIVKVAAFFLDANPVDDANHGREVNWMGTSGISTGWEVTGGREFRGLRDVTRCDFAAFLYRLGDLADDGERNDSIALSDAEVESVLATVSDCDANTSHAAEVAWLVDSGISRGWPDKGKSTVSFRPMAKVARQDMAAFLYRFADIRDDGEQNKSLKKGPEKVTFTDVRHGDDANHAAEVEWLASVGVTKGWAKGSKFEFRGKKTVARQDMAAFMYRLNSYLG